MMIIIALVCTFTFVACSNADATDDSDVATLVMNKRYINKNYVSKDTEKQIFYVFHANGTGEYTYHYDHDYVDASFESHTHNHYIIRFNYTYVDDDKSAVVCFYDSIERLDGDDGTYKATTWTQLVTVSKNVLVTVETSYIFWINEDYLKTLPHFGEK